MTMIPIELAEAREQRDAAWSLYGRSIDDESYTKEMRDKAGQVAEAWDDTCQDWYDRWQKLGGTSDIRSIVEAEADPRTDEQIALDEWQAETEATHKSAIRDGVSSAEWYDGQEEVEF